MGRGSAGRVLLLALALFLAQHRPASAVPKGYCVFFDDVASAPGLLAGLTPAFSILYILDAIGAIVLQIDDTLVQDLINLSGVLAVIPDKLYKTQTTHSWEFLGLESRGKRNPEWEQITKYGQGVIIANVDSGVSPTSASFQDDGLAPLPTPPWRWRLPDRCDAGKDADFRCNNKLIGARYFTKGIQVETGGSATQNQTDMNSPRDYNGHGSHTLSTAGGGFVPGAGVFGGHGNGTAKGGSPRAYVASYKACNAQGVCSGVDALKAVVTAVRDGVHVLSLSIGAPASDDATELLAIGALYAIRNGVVVVAAAGNDGPTPGSVTNVAPWMLTVGASTMDRDFPAQVTFGAGATKTTIQGRSLSTSTLPAGTEYPMISGEKASATESTDNSTLCFPGSLDQAKVKGKIVVCTRGVNGRLEKGQVVKEAGGIGMVLCNGESTGEETFADPHVIPAAHCSFSQCRELFTYLNSEPSPVGYITATDAQLGVKPAPAMAAFSSRGPNTITPQILKPDITAPGVQVIAAYTEEASPSDLPSDDRRVPYNIFSGTSMACPHVAGVAGLLKAKYRHWSPAMIKSAIMTTANNYSGEIREETGGAPATPLGYGAGHVNPLKALDPGLVYDTKTHEYASFLCSTTKPNSPTGVLGLGALLPIPIPLFSRLLSRVLGISPFQCSSGSYRPENLNYPSITVVCLSPGAAVTVKRRVMNVLDATAVMPRTYDVAVVQPAGIKVTVEPRTVSFGKIYEEKEFSVKLEVYDAAAAAGYVFGSIEWSDSGTGGTHRVRSPVVATTKCG